MNKDNSTNSDSDPKPSRVGAQPSTGDASKTQPASAKPRPQPKTWMETHGRDLKFIVIFVTLMSTYYIATTTVMLNERFFPWYLDTTAEAGGAVLQAVGYENVRVIGKAIDTMDGSTGTITVGRGCDAIAPTALFISAVIASPASIGSRLFAVLAGTTILMTVNLVRIISLFLTAVHWPAIFDFMHLDAWQWAFIALAVFMWGVWASRAAARKRKRLTDAPA